MADQNTHMVCKNCGSRNTQLMHVAFSKSVRSGPWHESISGFGCSLRPPEPKSVVVWPILAGAIGFVCGVGGYLLHGDLTENKRLFTDPVVRAAAIHLGYWAGCITTIIRSVTAIWHNQYRYPGQYERWEGLGVCHRCSHRFPVTRIAEFLEKTDAN